MVRAYNLWYKCIFQQIQDQTLTNVLFSYIVFSLWHKKQSQKEHTLHPPILQRFLLYIEGNCFVKLLLIFFIADWYIIKGQQLLWIPLIALLLQYCFTVPHGEKAVVDKFTPADVGNRGENKQTVCACKHTGMHTETHTHRGANPTLGSTFYNEPELGCSTDAAFSHITTSHCRQGTERWNLQLNLFSIKM